MDYSVLLCGWNESAGSLCAVMHAHLLKSQLQFSIWPAGSWNICHSANNKAIASKFQPVTETYLEVCRSRRLPQLGVLLSKEFGFEPLDQTIV